MKNTFIILGAVLLVSLLIAGCAAKQKNGTPAAQNPPPASVSSGNVAANNTPGGTAGGTAGGNAGSPAVTQDDLNKLKSGISGIQPEDVGGLPSN